MTAHPSARAAAWAASGAMFLTGRPDGPPLGPPEGFVARLRAIGDILSRASGEVGRRLDVDVLALLGERAALAGLRRGGDVSCGGAARLLPTADGWLAVNLPRPDDVDLLPAWLAGIELPPDPGYDPGRTVNPERITHRYGGQSARAVSSGPGGPIWAALAAAVAREPAEPLAQRAQLLGLAVAALPHGATAAPSGTGAMAGLAVGGRRIGDGGGRRDGGGRGGPDVGLEGVVVTDLSSLWAGPLCSQLLQQAGARVIKIESVHRPDGARAGPAAFFDLLHGGQEAVALDFRTPDGRADLRRLLESADVVIEGSRPRALEQLGIFAEQIIDTGGPRVWASITGYGRNAAGRDRVAFGDDAAAAGGLVVWDEAGPCFCADAVADPCAGLVAAATTLQAVRAGGRWLLDVSMRDVAAHLAGPSASSPGPPPEDGLVVAPPRARRATGRAPTLGEHTAAVLAELGLGAGRR